MSGLMRAIRVSQFGGPSVLKLCLDVPIPKITDTQVLVYVHSVGVNPVDTYIRSGTHEVKPTLPYTPAVWDVAGEVVEAGSKVSKVKKGDRVFSTRVSSGSYAEYVAVDQHCIFALGAKLSYNEGAAIGLSYATAFRGLIQKGHAKKGEVVLVHGASGGVGTAACQIANAMGMQVIGTAGSEEGLALVRQCGATHAVNHNDPNYTKQIQELTNNQGVDVTLEMLANVNLEKDMEMAAKFGRIAIIGSRGTIEVTPRKAMPKELTISGISMPNANSAELEELGDFLATGLKDGWLKPIVGVEFPLEQAELAHIEVIQHQQKSKGKVILKVI